MQTQITFILLLISQYLVGSCGTRLPLEVYELTPAAAAAAVTTTNAADGAAAEASATRSIDLKHKILEYTTYDAKTLAKHDTAADTAAISTPTTKAADLSLVSISAEEQHSESSIEGSGSDVIGHSTSNEHRRSRQMLLSQRGLQLQRQQQQQQQQQHLLLNERKHVVAGANSVVATAAAAMGKDVRILYQVGDSEDDLPICAANAVCSKIDLYETPWIERQCRCPESNRMPNIILHHHHNSHREALQDNSNNNKYHSYYEKEKLLQHKRLLLGEFNDKKFESLHLKKLMQKLGAVYEDDLHLQASDYLEQDYNDALPGSAQDYAEINDNEFPYERRAHFGTAHMRHSGHRAGVALTYIGGCPSSLGIEDGHTIADKTRHYKLCQPVHKLPVCKHFRDYTWTLTTSAELNVTEQIVHCRCPKNSVTYLTKREAAAPGTSGYTYLFACSPLTRIRCQRKQPCKLFTVRKRQEFLDEVNINALCQCPKGHHCPSHHTQSSVIAGETFLEDNIQTYSGYCMAND